jgi:hypothetical protein
MSEHVSDRVNEWVCWSLKSCRPRNYKIQANPYLLKWNISDNYNKQVAGWMLSMNQVPKMWFMEPHLPAALFLWACLIMKTWGVTVTEPTRFAWGKFWLLISDQMLLALDWMFVSFQNSYFETLNLQWMILGVSWFRWGHEGGVTCDGIWVFVRSQRGKNWLFRPCDNMTGSWLSEDQAATPT